MDWDVSADGVTASPTGRPTTSADLLDADQTVFLDWLADPALPDEIVARRRRPTERTVYLLGRLATSPYALPVAAAAVVGLPAGTSMGTAAVALVLAVEDPVGPCCPSYRAAAHHLRRLADAGDGRPASAGQAAARPRAWSRVTRTDP